MNNWMTRWALTLFGAVLALAMPNRLAATNAVPFLNPLVPAAATPGGTAFTLTVTGTGFVAGATILWNGAPRPTTFVNNSKLTAAISASDISATGTAAITVVNPGPGGGTSNVQLFQVANIAPQLYWTTRDVVTNVAITSPLAAGDFMGDGKLDLVGAVGQIIYVLPGNGDGTFQAARGSQGPGGATITSVNVADINGDGKLDLIVAGSKNSTTSFVATMIGNGDGTFTMQGSTDFSGAHFPSRPIIADVDGDGILDFVYAMATGIQTLLGNGDGTFRTGPSSPLSQIGLSAVAAGDFNNDGKLDLVVTVYDPFTTGLEFVGVMPGVGDGSFGTLVSVPGTSAAFASGITAVVGDFNGDGKLDIATGIQTAGASIQGFLEISLGNGDGTFQSAISVPNVSAVTTPLLVGDFNGDGTLDLVTGGFAYFGQGDGTFPTSQGSSGLPSLVLAGDFNGDGKLDVLNQTVTTSHGTALTSVGLFLQTPPAPDFTGIATPFSSTLVPGGSVSLVATVQPLNGFTGDVIVSVSDLPNGVSVSYNPVVVHGGSGTSTITLTASPAVPLGNYTVTLTGNSGAITHSTSMPLVVNDSVGDWTGSVGKQTQNVPPGASAPYTITAIPVGGFAGDITLTASGLPAGATATFSPAIIAGGSGSSILTIKTSATTPQPGVYTITVTGTNGILVHNTTVYLGVSSSAGDFNGSATPSTGSAPASGGSATFTVGVTPITGGAGDVTLSVSGLPAGATANFMPSVVQSSSGTSTLVITTAAGTPPGVYQINISSTGTGVIHQTSVSLTVTP
jgi:hypothetical protein